MKDHLAPETLPTLYRSILDDVWALERAGSRRRAAGLRTAATRAYSRAWDERAVRQLEEIGRTARRELAAASDGDPASRLSPISSWVRDVRHRLPQPVVGSSHSTSPGLG